ncbi:unnamed protein product [Didymodactylos carnosus]|uniref:Uncharacterized protein n=1 Tax=Didymodactylos carnosus TaxID=1234261 RepID=A0A8S2F4U7_9BILA|nr:unnamed protein product [Didymodactylos carnosus]CAF4136552.1 unnamed protein product [Didymodactylos carnosus]
MQYWADLCGSTLQFFKIYRRLSPSKAHFIVPISQTYVDVQCKYSLKKDQFSFVTHRGNMARSCKLLSNIEFLRKGSIIIHENENILGELMLPYDIYPNSSYDFVLGADPDVTYEEEVIMKQDCRVNKSSTDSYTSYPNRRTIYQINGKIRNFKTNELNVQYITGGDIGNNYGVKILKPETGAFNSSRMHLKYVIPGEHVKEYSYTIQSDSYTYSYTRHSDGYSLR